MGALTPFFLLAGLAVGVPIFIHLFHRQDTLRLSFPALRYLERTERERAREIRLRQLLLLVTRVAVLILLVGAGARLFFSGRGSAHRPTAVAIVLDNSMSSGLVVGESRVLDGLKALALEALDEAVDGDTFWLVRAGEPWLPALPGAAEAVREAVESTDASDGAGDVTAALERALRLLSTSDLEAREVHLLTDGQATGLTDLGRIEPMGVPILVRAPAERARPNDALVEALVGGGLPPLEGQRSEIAVEALGHAGDTSRLSVRIVLNDRIRAAATVPPGATASLSLPPSGPGWVRGYADLDPDALRADDRRYFAYRSRRAPTVAVAGAAGIFVEEGVGVLVAAARATLGTSANAELVLCAEGEGLERLAAGASAVVLPPVDPARLPALNRRLAESGIAWRYELRDVAGEAVLTGRQLPAPLSGARARSWYRLTLAREPEDASTVIAEIGADPWAVQGETGSGRRYLLLASPLDEFSTDLPTSTAMLRFLDWAASEWAGRGGAEARYVVGDHVPAPHEATHVRVPSGDVLEIDGTRVVRGTGRAGFYTFLADEDELAVVAVNVPESESYLDPIAGDVLAERLGDGVVFVDDDADWARAVFRARQGPELWWPLLLGALLLLALEAMLAASGRSERSAGRRTREQRGAVDVAA